MSKSPKIVITVDSPQTAVHVGAPSVSVQVEVKDSEARSKRTRDESGQMASSSSDVPPKGGENSVKSGDLQDGSAGKAMKGRKM